jgi:putative endonuclease
MRRRGGPPATDRQKTGRYWEDAASRYLARHGIETVLRGYRCRLGELDLVCAEAERLIVVEVRARSTSAYAGALSSIDSRKRRKIVLATRHLLMRHPSWYQRPLRFDVVAFDRIDSASPEMRWIRNAFDANG